MMDSELDDEPVLLEFQRIKGEINELRGKRESTVAVLADRRIQFRTARRRAKAVKEGLIFAQRICKEIQRRVHRRIASLVTRCLQTIFDEPIHFHIEFVERRNKTEAELYFKSGDNLSDPLSDSGGAVDIAAFALRLSCLLSTAPARRRLLVMDEPFKHLSIEFRDRLGELLETLAEELDFNFIIITHIPELRIGKVIEFPLKDGK